MKLKYTVLRNDIHAVLVYVNSVYEHWMKTRITEIIQE